MEDRGFQYGRLDQQHQRAWNLAVVEQRLWAEYQISPLGGSDTLWGLRTTVLRAQTFGTKIHKDLLFPPLCPGVSLP